MDYHPLPLTNQCLRALTDKQYEKRKWAAGEIEKTVKKAKFSREFQDIDSIIKCLSDLATSTIPNSRKGGVIGLASVAVALGPDLKEEYIEQTIRPMFASLDDQDSQVRFYTCEALFNILKLANTGCLALFDDIFDKMAKLSADTDPEMKNALEAIDKVLKNIIEMTDKSFDVMVLIKLIRDRALVKNIQTKQFIMSWVNFLKNKMLHIDMLEHFHHLIDGIFHILSESNEEIRKQCEDVLEYYLRKIKQSPNKVDFAKMINPIILYTGSNYNDVVRFRALTWIHELLNTSPLSFLPYLSGLLASILPCLSMTKSQSAYIEDGVVINYTNTKTSTRANFVPSYDIQAIADVINEKVKTLVTDELKRESHTHTQGDGNADDEKGGQAAAAASAAAIQKLNIQQTVELKNVMEVLVSNFTLKNSLTKVAVLKWIIHLDTEIPEKVKLYREEEIYATLIDLLSEDLEYEVLDLDLQVLGRILTSPFVEEEAAGDQRKLVYSSVTNIAYFNRFISTFLIYLADKSYLEKKGFNIIKQLCKYVNPEDVYLSLSFNLYESNMLIDNKDKIIQALNKILLTSSELYNLRFNLRDSGSSKSYAIFTDLYKTWCISPISALSLCYLGKNYTLAYRLVMVFAHKGDINLPILHEIDKLIQFIESPIFAYLRIDLLDTKNVFLIKSLYGLMMLLPQTKAFHVLRKRLQCVPNIKLDEKDASQTDPIEKHCSLDELVQIFDETLDRCNRSKKREDKI